MTSIADAPENPLPVGRSRSRRGRGGVIGWLRANLFSSIPSTVISLLLIFLLAKAGVSLLHGFRQSLYAAMGGVQGCSHITELMAQAPTAAIQMFAGLSREIEGDAKPFQLDRCHALETSTDTVRRYYARWYRGAA